MKQGELKGKTKIYSGIIIGLLLILGIKLAVVQLFYTDVYQTQARENRIRLLSIKAPRGEIYDRTGKTLAASKLVYTLSLSYPNAGDLEQVDPVIDRLSDILKPNYPEITTSFIKEKIDLQKFRQFEPVVLVRDIPWDLVVKLEENRRFLPGVTISIEPLRVYPQDTLAGHVLGYIHSIDSEELANASEKYNINSLIGKSGIEKQYEKELRGKDGARRVEVDAQGRPVGELVTLDPQPGNNITLTLDHKLQKVMEKSMADNLERLQKSYPKAKVASAVVLDVKSGEVLALGSSPTMKPDDFKGQLKANLVPYYFGDKVYNPLNPGAALNRAIQTSYPPGSTFKPITGIAALEAGMNPLDDLVNCPGRYWIAPYIGCTGSHGNVNYYSAMAKSCNTYFQEMGRRAGKNNLIKVAQELGLGEKTGIDLPHEVKGLVPTPEWKKELNVLLIDRKYQALRKQLEEKYKELKTEANGSEQLEALEKQEKNERAKLEAQYRIDYNFDTNWQPFDTFNMSIGQGSNSFTVIQLAQYVATVANGGNLMQPHLVKKIENSNHKLIKQFQPHLVRQVNVAPLNLAETRRAMVEVSRPGGTAYFLFKDFPASVQVGAKTGTAETGRAGDKKDGEYHGVFIAFAPYENPEIAFAGVVEYGRHGSESAGWIAKAVFEQYFGIKDHFAEIEQENWTSKSELGGSPDVNPETTD